MYKVYYLKGVKEFSSYGKALTFVSKIKTYVIQYEGKIRSERLDAKIKGYKFWDLKELDTIDNINIENIVVNAIKKGVN